MATTYLWDKNSPRRWQYIKGGVTLGWVLRGHLGSFYPERSLAMGCIYGPECLTLDQAQTWVEAQS